MNDNTNNSLSVTRARAGKSEASLRNLKPYDSETAKKMGSIGGKKRSEQKAQQKKLRELVKEIMSVRANHNVHKSVKEWMPAAKDKDITNNIGMICALMAKAISEGDVAAATWLRDTMGEKPKEEGPKTQPITIILTGDEGKV